MSDALRLADRELIRQQKAKYCRLLDTKQFDGLERIFEPDAQIIFYDIDDTVVMEFGTAVEFTQVTRKFFATTRTVHQAHHPEMRFLSETEASAIWSMEDWHVETSAGQDPPNTMHGYGFYHEVWRLVGQEWKLARMELRRHLVLD